jgi:DNA-binding transcriptional regulator YiaG
MDALPFSTVNIQVNRQPSNYPNLPKTLSEHIRKRRYDLQLLQKDVARIIGVSEDTITYWENGRSEPTVVFYPKIVSFLGYFPFEIDISTLGGRIKKYRFEHGLTLNQFGKLVSADGSTIASWEAQEHQPQNKKLGLLTVLGIVT